MGGLEGGLEFKKRGGVGDMKRTFHLTHDTARRGAEAYCHAAPDGWMVQFSEPSRNLEQNAAMWPILDAFSKQIQWPVNGMMVKMSADEWKDVLSAAFDRESLRVAMGLDGGMVMLGRRTSLMGKAKFSEFLEFLHATAALRGVLVYEPQDD